MQAALGLGQLKRIKNIIKTKKKIGNYYYNEFKNNKKILVQAPIQNKEKNIYWIFGILINDNKFKKQDVIKKLLKMGIQSRDFFGQCTNKKYSLNTKCLKKKNFQ